MKTAKTITHVLFPLFIGLIIGGAITSNTAAWLSGLVLLIIDILIGITLQYYIEKPIYNNFDNLYFEEISKSIHANAEKVLLDMHNRGIDFDDTIDESYNDYNDEYVTRIKKIMWNKNAKAYFTPKEIVNAIVNLADAKKVLSQEEYYFIIIIFETFSMLNKKLLLNRDKFMELSNEIIAHFDLIAPYYKFCGSNDTLFEELFDKEKGKYRYKAKKLLTDEKIFTPEWMNLHEEFLQAFYKF